MKKFALLFTVATVFAISCENKTEEVAPDAATTVEETVAAVDSTATAVVDSAAAVATEAAAPATK
jgi:hypothetical protein